MAYAHKQLKSLAGKAVHQWRMIEDGDHIVVALSGGKDSWSLLKFLHERRARVPIGYQLTAVHIDMGFDREGQLRQMAQYLEHLGIPFHAERTDYGPRAHTAENRENPCFLCARLRRNHLFSRCRELKANKLALGHNRDDLNETLLMNIFYIGEISTMLPVQTLFSGGLTVIRPLAMTPESVIRRTAKDEDFPIFVNDCPSAGNSARSEIKALIMELAKKNKKIPANIFRALNNVNTAYMPAALDPSPLPRVGPTAGANKGA